MEISQKVFDRLSDNRIVKSFLLENDNNMSVEILELGGIIRSLKVADRNGEISDVVLGYDTLQSYVEDKSYFGATVGSSSFNFMVFPLNSRDIGWLYFCFLCRLYGGSIGLGNFYYARNKGDFAGRDTKTDGYRIGVY